MFATLLWAPPPTHSLTLLTSTCCARRCARPTAPNHMAPMPLRSPGHVGRLTRTQVVPLHRPVRCCGDVVVCQGFSQEGFPRASAHTAGLERLDRKQAGKMLHEQMETAQSNAWLSVACLGTGLPLWMRTRSESNWLKEADPDLEGLPGF